MSEMAKSLVFTGERQLEIREYPVPEVSDDKVLIKVDASAICTWEQRVYTGVKKVEFPFIGGHVRKNYCHGKKCGPATMGSRRYGGCGSDASLQKLLPVQEWK